MNISRDFLLLAAGRAAQVVIAFATLRFATAMLSPAEFGLFALLTGFRTLFGLFLISPVGQHVNRHTHEWFDEHTLISHLKTYNRYILLVSMLAGISLVGWSWIHAEHGLHTLSNAAIMAAVILTGTWNATLIPMLNMLDQRVQAVSLELLTSGLTLIAAVILCTLDSTGVMWFAGTIAGMLLGGWLAWHLIIRLQPQSWIKPKTPFLDVTTIRQYCMPLALATGLMWFYTTSYRFVIEWFWGAEKLGAFAFGYIFASQIWAVFEALITQFIYPYFYRAIANAATTAHDQAYDNLVNTVLPLYLFLLAMLITGADVLMPFVAHGSAYQNFSKLLPYAFLFEFFRVASALLSQASQVKKTTRQNILPYAIGGTCVLLGTIACAQLNLSMQAVSVSLAAAGTMLLTTMYLNMRRLATLQLDVHLLRLPLIICLMALAIKPALNITLSVGLTCLIAIAFATFVKFRMQPNPHLKMLLNNPPK